MGHGGYPGEVSGYQAAVKADGTSVYRMCPLDIDDLVEPEMDFAKMPTRIERLQGDGTWRLVDFKADQSGYVRMMDTIRAKNPAVYRYEMSIPRR